MSSFFCLWRNVIVSRAARSVCLKSNSQKELSPVEYCWKRALCVCWQREEIGTVGGLPALLFKYIQRYWVTPEGGWGGRRLGRLGLAWGQRADSWVFLVAQDWGVGIRLCASPRGKTVKFRACAAVFSATFAPFPFGAVSLLSSVARAGSCFPWCERASGEKHKLLPPSPSPVTHLISQSQAPDV